MTRRDDADEIVRLRSLSAAQRKVICELARGADAARLAQQLAIARAEISTLSRRLYRITHQQETPNG